MHAHTRAEGKMYADANRKERTSRGTKIESGTARINKECCLSTRIGPPHGLCATLFKLQDLAKRS